MRLILLEFLESMTLRTVAEASECFIEFCICKTNTTVPLQLQVLEFEHLDSSKDDTLPNRNVIKSGIEFDKLGRLFSVQGTSG